VKTFDIHIRDPYILPLPEEGRYYLLARFAKDERQRGTQILVSDRPEGPYRLHSNGPVTPRPGLSSNVRPAAASVEMEKAS
jgi:hypothetical protein